MKPREAGFPALDAPVILAGGGPAGASAALWLLGAEVDFVWIEPEPRRRTLERAANRIGNLAGFPGVDGNAVDAAIRSHIDAAISEHQAARGRRCAQRVRAFATSIGRRSGAMQVVTRDGGGESRSFSARHLLLCTGTRPRLLGVDGADTTHGVHLGVTAHVDTYAEAEVVVVGGGDAALEGALLLAQRSPLVHILVRGTAFRGQRRFVDAVTSHPSIRVRFRSEVVGIERSPEATIRAVHLADGTRLAASALFVRIGVEPIVPEGIPASVRDAQGYVRADADGRTRWRGLWAAGDVASPRHQSVAWALGSGARAAEAIQGALGLKMR